MKALSLTQPWASLVVAGRKTVETRGWRLPIGMEGQRVAIHASKGMPPWAEELARAWGLDPDALPRGAVVGEVTIVGSQRTEETRHRLEPEEIEFGDFSSGRWAWFLTHPTEYEEPIPARGALGFWEWAR